MVKNILGMIAGGYGVEQILNAYPELTREMVEAALQYVAAVIDDEYETGQGDYTAERQQWLGNPDVRTLSERMRRRSEEPDGRRTPSPSRK